MNEAIKITNLKKSYDKTIALKGIDISIIDAYGRKTLFGNVFSSDDSSPIENALVIAVAEDSSFNAQANSDENGFSMYTMFTISMVSSLFQF